MEGDADSATADAATKVKVIQDDVCKPTEEVIKFIIDIRVCSEARVKPPPDDAIADSPKATYVTSIVSNVLDLQESPSNPIRP